MLRGGRRWLAAVVRKRRGAAVRPAALSTVEFYVGVVDALVDDADGAVDCQWRRDDALTPGTSSSVPYVATRAAALEDGLAPVPATGTALGEPVRARRPHRR